MPMVEMLALTGQRIKEVREMTQAERDAEGWEAWNTQGTVVIVLESGMTIYPSQDPEGNGGGTLFGNHKGTSFYVMPED